jgi:hypothetical protein
MAVTLTSCTPFVNEPAQDAKKFWHAVDFIDDNELGGLRSQIGFWVFQAAAV